MEEMEHLACKVFLVLKVILDLQEALVLEDQLEMRVSKEGMVWMHHLDHLQNQEDSSSQLILKLLRLLSALRAPCLCGTATLCFIFWAMVMPRVRILASPGLAFVALARCRICSAT